VEQAIAKTWRELLPVGELDMHDNFFDLGGHSLLVVTMVRKLLEEHQLEVSLGTVFAAPTIAELAARIERPARDDEEPFVLPLRGGGQNIPLFCICGLHLYAPLAKALGEGQPVYGVFVPAENQLFEQDVERPERWPDIPVLAADYIRAMRAERPHGPYCLAGVSFGGLLAFEMARQLTEAGEEVRMLALFDSILPRGVRRDPATWVRGHLRRLVTRGPRHVLERLAMRAHKHAQGHDAEREVHQLANLRERIYMAAMDKYDRTVQPYRGHAVVFRACDQSAMFGYQVDRECGWGELLEQGVTVHDIPGDHLGILGEAGVHMLARALREHLDRASRAQAPLLGAARRLRAGGVP
jgi:thioesterase domain-containing protein